MARRSLKLPITLAVTMIALLVALTVGWILLAVFGALADESSAGLYWTLLSVGTVFMLFLVLGVVLYLTLSIKAINLGERQSNFLDSVTHELKSPIASLRLYLQTLDRRAVGVEERAGFIRSMLGEVDRLDRLINHLLDVGRLEADRVGDEVEDVPLDELLEACARTVCRNQNLEESTIQLDTAPCVVTARRVDLEMIFRNLLDNAIKYSTAPPHVDVTLRAAPERRVVVRIADNGPRIPRHLRRKIFKRFVRLGSELERDKPGTGLGLYIVRTLVKRQGGRVRVLDRDEGAGAVFEVQLPGQPEFERPPSG